MSTNSVIGFYTDKSKLEWKGVYCHSDGYPTGVGYTLVENWRNVFKGDTQKIVDYIMQSKKGWSGIAGTNFNHKPTWNGARDVPSWYDDREGETEAPPFSHNDKDVDGYYVYLFCIEENLLYIYSTGYTSAPTLLGTVNQHSDIQFLKQIEEIEDHMCMEVPLYGEWRNKVAFPEPVLENDFDIEMPVEADDFDPLESAIINRDDYEVMEILAAGKYDITSAWSLIEKHPRSIAQILIALSKRANDNAISRDWYKMEFAEAQWKAEIFDELSEVFEGYGIDLAQIGSGTVGQIMEIKEKLRG